MRLRSHLLFWKVRDFRWEASRRRKTPDGDVFDADSSMRQVRSRRRRRRETFPLPGTLTCTASSMAVAARNGPNKFKEAEWRKLSVDRVEDLVRLNLRWLPHFVVCQVERISMPVCQQLTTSLLLCNDRRWFVRSFEALVVHLDETQGGISVRSRT